MALCVMPESRVGRPVGGALPGAPAPTAAAGAVHILPPPPDLAPLVEYVWQLVLPGHPGRVWRVVVDGYLDLSVGVALSAELLRAVEASRHAPGAARRALAEALAAAPRVVCGAASTARELPMGVPQLLTGVRFRLGAAAGVLRRTPAELVDGARPLGDVVGGRTAEYAALALGAGARAPTAPAPPPADRAALGGDVRGDALAGAAPEAEAAVREVARAGVEAMVRGLVARAAARPGGARPADPRVRCALHLLDRATGGGAGVAAVARALAVSPRTLERLFAEHVGFAPRTYQRLRRVGAVALALERGAAPGGRAGAAGRPAPTLSALAHALGYTDHAHMTREFTGAMGVSPSRYRRDALAAPVARHAGAVAFERPTPLGTVAPAAEAAGASPGGAAAEAA